MTNHSPEEVMKKVDKLITRCEESMYHHNQDRHVARKELLDTVKSLQTENQKLIKDNKQLIDDKHDADSKYKQVFKENQKLREIMENLPYILYRELDGHKGQAKRIALQHIASVDQYPHQ